MTTSTLTKRLGILCAISALLLSSCKREKTTWDTNVLLPLVSTELTVGDLLEENEQIIDDGTSPLRFVLEDTLISINAADVFEMPDTTADFGSSLQTLTLPNDSVETIITFGDILTAGGYGALLPFIDGQTISVNPISNVPIDPINIDNSSLFESVTVETGNMVVTIENNLPLELQNVELLLTNSPGTGGDTIATETFASIPAGSTASAVIPLDGKTISSQLVAQIVDFSSPGGSALIDITDQLIARVKFVDIVPSSATAIWPEQNLIDTTSFTEMNQSLGVMMKNMKVKEGDIQIDVFSSLQDTMYLTYTVPNLELNGQIFVATASVPPASPGGISTITRTFSFNGYDFNLNGYGAEAAYGEDMNGNAMFDPDTINAYVQNTKVRIAHTGKMVTLSQSDTVYFKVRVLNVVPEEVYGFMGKDTMKVGPETIDFEQFGSFISGRLKLEDVQMDITMQNGIGAAADISIDNLSGTNNNNSTSVTLGGSAVSGNHRLDKATETGSTPPVNQSTMSINLDKDNSNINEFASNLSDELTYELSTILNPDLSFPLYTDVLNNPPNFLYDGYGISTAVRLEFPLSMVAEELTLLDTMGFNLTGIGDKFEKGDFTLVVENGFAFDATISLIMLDQDSLEYGNLLKEGFIERGTVDANGKVSETKKSIIQFSVDAATVQKMKTIERLKVEVKLHNYPVNSSDEEYHKIFSSDYFNIKLIVGTAYTTKF